MEFTGSYSIILTLTLSPTLSLMLTLNLTSTLTLDVYNMGPHKRDTSHVWYNELPCVVCRIS